MNKNQSNLFRFTFLSLVAVLTLSACGQSLEAPEVVMGNAKQALVEIESGKAKVTVSMEGDSEAEDLSLNGKIDFAFDASDEANKKLELSLDASGNMQADEQTLDGELSFGFITLDKEYYVMLNKFNTSDESLDAMKPFLDMYTNKWLRIAEDFIPEDIRGLQTQDEEFGVETLNGRDVYHYGLTVNPNGFRDYVTKAAIIDGRELTTQEVDEAVQVLNYIKEVELYIDTKDYYVLKSVFKFSGEAISEEGANLTIEIVVEGSDFNKAVKIEAPEGAEDFNPLNLLMGLGSVPATEDTTDISDTSDAMEDVMMGGETTDPVVTE
jgi:hypothetical protein